MSVSIQTNSVFFQELIDVSKTILTDKGLDKQQVQILKEKIDEFIVKNQQLFIPKNFGYTSKLPEIRDFIKEKLVGFAASIKGTPTDAQASQLKRRHKQLVDFLEAAKMGDTRSTLITIKLFNKFADAIQNDDKDLVIKFLNKGYTPKFAILDRSENKGVPTSHKLREQTISGLAIAGANGSEKVHDLLLETQDPNYCIQFIYPDRDHCQCGDGACGQYSVIPAWLATVASEETTLQTKLIFLQKQLERGANPLLLDSDGNFWLSRIVSTSHLAPACMHLLMGSLKDCSQFYRTNLDGKRVSLLHDLYAKFKHYRKHLLPSTVLNSGVSARNHNLTKEDIEAIQKWQENFFNSIAVLIAHGIECPPDLIEKIEKELKIEVKLHKKNIAVVNANKLTTRTPKQAITVIEAARKEAKDSVKKLTEEISSEFTKHCGVGQTAAQPANPIDMISQLTAQYTADERLMAADVSVRKMFVV